MGRPWGYEVQTADGMANAPLLWVWEAVTRADRPITTRQVARAVGWPARLVSVLLAQAEGMGLVLRHEARWVPGDVDPFEVQAFYQGLAEHGPGPRRWTADEVRRHGFRMRVEGEQP